MKSLNILTYRHFCFNASHWMDEKEGAARHPHWHSYRVTIWFRNAPDQDALIEEMEKKFNSLHGCSLNSTMRDSSDEGLVKWFMDKCPHAVRVRVENDGQRGAEATRNEFLLKS